MEHKAGDLFLIFFFFFFFVKCLDEIIEKTKTRKEVNAEMFIVE